MKLSSFKCSQCGSSDFEQESKDKLRCKYCSSLYAIEKPPKVIKKSAKVIISKGAKVKFGKNANVTIKGGLEIQDGADVEFNGKITLIEKSDDKKIENAKTKLKRIQE
ncbi:MAG: hypothetical protein ABFS35_00035 [Bacteroidota bacterium]